MRNLTTAKVFGYGGLALIVLSGLIITSTRAVRVIQQTLPDSDHLMAYCALGMVGFGVVLWCLVFKLLAQGPYQRAISLGMVFICLSGDIAAMFLDSFTQTGKRGLTAAVNSDQLSAAVIAVLVVISLNLIAAVLMELVPVHGAVPAPVPVYQPQPIAPQQEVKVMSNPPAPALPRGQEINPALVEVKESESQPGHYADEVQIPFLGTKPLKSRNGKRVTNG